MGCGPPPVDAGQAIKRLLGMNCRVTRGPEQLAQFVGKLVKEDPLAKEEPEWRRYLTSDVFCAALQSANIQEKPGQGLVLVVCQGQGLC